MAKKKSSNVAATTEEHPERLSIEETWPAEHLREQDDSVRGYATGEPSEDDGTDVFAAHDDSEAACEIGLSSEGPFIAPAPAPEAPASSTTGKRAKLTVASMTREQAFGTFRDKLFELCFKYGFTIVSRGDSIPQVEAIDIGDAKGTAKRALAVGNHISGLELLK